MKKVTFLATTALLALTSFQVTAKPISVDKINYDGMHIGAVVNAKSWNLEADDNQAWLLEFLKDEVVIGHFECKDSPCRGDATFHLVDQTFHMMQMDKNHLPVLDTSINSISGKIEWFDLTGDYESTSYGGNSTLSRKNDFKTEFYKEVRTYGEEKQSVAFRLTKIDSAN